MSRVIKLLFHKRGATDDLYGNGTLTGQRDDNNCPIRFDCETEIPTEQNIESVELKSADGRTITLSEYEIYCEPASWSGEDYDNDVEKALDIRFIGADGEPIPFDSFYNICYMEDHSYITFNELLDISDISGVMIKGVEYLR